MEREASASKAAVEFRDRTLYAQGISRSHQGALERRDREGCFPEAVNSPFSRCLIVSEEGEGGRAQKLIQRGEIVMQKLIERGAVLEREKGGGALRNPETFAEE